LESIEHIELESIEHIEFYSCRCCLPKRIGPGTA
jgi:hypothetical protein